MGGGDGVGGKIPRTDTGKQTHARKHMDTHTNRRVSTQTDTQIKKTITHILTPQYRHTHNLISVALEAQETKSSGWRKIIDLSGQICKENRIKSQ